MAKPLNALGSIITVVVFLALIALATVLYSGNPERQNRMENNFFLRYTKLAMDYLFVGAQGVADISLGKKYDGASQASTTVEAGAAEKGGFFQQIRADIKTEWENGNAAQASSSPETNLNKFWELKDKIYQYFNIR